MKRRQKRDGWWTLNSVKKVDTGLIVVRLFFTLAKWQESNEVRD